MKGTRPLDRITHDQNRRLGWFLIEWCKEHDVSFHKMCSLMRISPSTIEGVLGSNPERYPTYRAVEKIAYWHNIPLDKLIGLREDTPFHEQIEKQQWPVVQHITVESADNENTALLAAIALSLEEIRHLIKTTWCGNDIKDEV